MGRDNQVLCNLYKEPGYFFVFWKANYVLQKGKNQ